MSAADLTVARVTTAIRDAEQAADEFARNRPSSERNSYAYAYLLGCLSAFGVDVDAIRAEGGVIA